MINGAIFKDMIISGANNIENNKQEINDLNVFPVPDGDTGTNMSLTMNAAKKELLNIEDDNIGNVARIVSSALLKGARGNSGVILSLFFRGFSKELNGKEKANGVDFSKALNTGVKAAYKAVMKPTEGTILTVARVSADYGLEYTKRTQEILSVFEEIIRSANETLEKTPDMLPVLKQANVVDAGGKGLIVIYEGMLSVLKNNIIIELLEKEQRPSLKADFQSFKTEDIKFLYCTEFIINKNIGSNGQNLEAFLHTMGDSVVFAEDTDIIKVHIHTNNPGIILENAIEIGNLINIKIDNMKEQHSDLTNEVKENRVIAEAINEFGFVVVSVGIGLNEVFLDLGADNIVDGGQTMNPSTQDILKAIDKTPAKTVFVLPNNKNIIMAAKQTIPISEKNVLVLETKTIPQGIGAMLEFNPALSKKENEKLMNSAIRKVKTGLVTFAVRNSVLDEKEIKQGEIIGLIENKIAYIEKEIEKCSIDVIKKLTKEGANFVSIFYGIDITEQQANELKEKIKEFVNAEINIVFGGQPVYYYIISVE